MSMVRQLCLGFSVLSNTQTGKCQNFDYDGFWARSLAMASSCQTLARTMDPHSATAQFFINVKDNDFLNHSGKNMQGWGYAVFAKVSAGSEVLDKIRAVATTSRGGHQDVPADPIIIESVEIVED